MEYLRAGKVSNIRVDIHYMPLLISPHCCNVNIHTHRRRKLKRFPPCILDRYISSDILFSILTAIIFLLNAEVMPRIDLLQITIMLKSKPNQHPLQPRVVSDFGNRIIILVQVRDGILNAWSWLYIMKLYINHQSTQSVKIDTTPHPNILYPGLYIL